MYRRMMSLVSLRFLLIGVLCLSGCVTSNTDNRTMGTIVDDNMLEVMVAKEIRRSDDAYKGAHLVVAAYDGLILIVGQVPSDALKKQATTVAEGMYKVEPGNVHNHLTIGGPTTLLARTNDGYLTTRAKTSLVLDEGLRGLRIKVLTENGVVFLLGSVTRAQADRAVEVISKTYGVQKIVKVFAYIDSDEPI